MSLPPFRVSHVVFDVDGTLVDFVGAYRAGMAAAAARVSELSGKLITRQELQQAQRLATTEIAALGLPRGQAHEEAFRHALKSVGCDEHGVVEITRARNEARDAALQPYDDVEDALALLHQRGLALVAASNGNGDMARLSIFRYFTTTWFAETAGVSKPDSRFYLGALEHAGVRPEAAIMVGDRIDNDYGPARGIGMHAVLLDRESRVDDPSIVRIRTLTELEGMIELA